MRKLLLNSWLVAVLCVLSLEVSAAGRNEKEKLSYLQSHQTKEDYFVKHLRFPENATLEQKVDMAARLVPTPEQLNWQRLELTAFLHFGINTFTGNEWGDGKEDPALFNPSELDAGQWVRTLKDAGFKMVTSPPNIMTVFACGPREQLLILLLLLPGNREKGTS